MYSLWTIYYRYPRPLVDMSFKTILMQTLGFLPAILPFFVALFVGASRIADFQHHPADVAVGFFIGFIMATIVFLRTICTNAMLYQN